MHPSLTYLVSLTSRYWLHSVNAMNVALNSGLECWSSLLCRTDIEVMCVGCIIRGSADGVGAKTNSGNL